MLHFISFFNIFCIFVLYESISSTGIVVCIMYMYIHINIFYAKHFPVVQLK